MLEVWEPEEQANPFFRERFVPALRALGFAGTPPRREFWPVHHAMS